IQTEPGKAPAFSERPKVEVEIRTELAVRGLLILFHRRRQEVEADPVVQPGEHADLGPDLGALRVGSGPRSARSRRSGARLPHRGDVLETPPKLTSPSIAAAAPTPPRPP